MNSRFVCLALVISFWAAGLSEGKCEPSPEAQQHCQAGRAAKAAQDYEKATAELKKALELAPDYVDAHWALAWVYVAKEDKEAAGAWDKCDDLWTEYGKDTTRFPFVER
jgi:Tfp pilus assembly protein PilF